MRLEIPCDGVNFATQDIYGEPISLHSLKGKRVMLSFFRDAACPFCNFRLYELTNNYKDWQKKGIEVIAVFSSTAQEVRQFVAYHPRPFRMIADPNLMVYNQYGIEQSASALFKAMLFKMPRIIKGIAKGGRPKKNPNVKIVPADFLLEIDGSVADLWYGRDTADHIPMERLQAFVDSPLKESNIVRKASAANNELSASEREELIFLRQQNKKLKAKLKALTGVSAL